MVGGSPSVNRLHVEALATKGGVLWKDDFMLVFIIKLLAFTSSAFGTVMGIEWLITKIKKHQKSNRRFPK